MVPRKCVVDTYESTKSNRRVVPSGWGDGYCARINKKITNVGESNRHVVLPSVGLRRLLHRYKA